jgi:hypothetical protein
VSVIRLVDGEVAQRSGRVGLEHVARQRKGARPDLLKEPQASCGAEDAASGVRVGAAFLRDDGARQLLLGKGIRDTEAAERADQLAHPVSGDHLHDKGRRGRLLWPVRLGH